MTDYFAFENWKGIKADSGNWYRAIELLGVGGNAATFLAYCTSNPQKGLLFAVKVFRRLSKPERKTTFLEEAKFLKGCQHPAIMRIFDEGTYYDSNPFAVMEYLPRTLGEVMRAGCSFLEKVTFSMQLLSALDFLSSEHPKVVHRDIKPANVFIKGGSCVLGDFGLMKRIEDDGDDDRSLIKESIGPGMPFYYRTPDLVAYMNGTAPLTTQTDVFQLGLVLAQLFTGRNPCVACDDFAAPLQIEEIGHIPSDFGGLVASLLKRMLDFDPATRSRPSELLDNWEGLFQKVVDAAHAVEDRAFHYE